MNEPSMICGVQAPVGAPGALCCQRPDGHGGRTKDDPERLCWCVIGATERRRVEWKTSPFANRAIRGTHEWRRWDDTLKRWVCEAIRTEVGSPTYNGGGTIY